MKNEVIEVQLRILPKLIDSARERVERAINRDDDFSRGYNEGYIEGLKYFLEFCNEIKED